MESWIVLPLLGLVLVWITIQDFRKRSVSLLALALLFVFGIVHSSLALQRNGLVEHILINSLFAGFILVSGTLLVKLRRSSDPVSALIGAGDLLFLLAISPLFAPGAYLVFLNTSMIIILVLYGILILVRSTPGIPTIPLAGAMALSLFLFFIADLLIPVDLMTRADWILNILA